MSEHADQTETELRAEIADTREQLGETVEALAHKLDVTGRGKAKAAELREAAMQRADTVVSALPEPAAAPLRRGVSTVIAHPAITVGALAGGLLVVRGVAKRGRR